MKNILLIAVGLLFLFAACSKDTQEAVPDQKQDMISLFGMSLSNPDQLVDPIDIPIDILSETYNEVISYRTPSVMSASGHYVTVGYGQHMAFSAVHNNGGNHGNINTWGNVDAKFDDVCVEASTDGIAIVSGKLKKLSDPGNTSPGFLELDYYYIWIVKDNGEGANAPADQYIANIWKIVGYDANNIVIPANPCPWGLFGFAPYVLPFFPFTDVAAGQIQVTGLIQYPPI